MNPVFLSALLIFLPYGPTEKASWVMEARGKFQKWKYSLPWAYRLQTPEEIS